MSIAKRATEPHYPRSGGQATVVPSAEQRESDTSSASGMTPRSLSGKETLANSRTARPLSALQHNQISFFKIGPPLVPPQDTVQGSRRVAHVNHRFRYVCTLDTASSCESLSRQACS